jgi:hypothetical protein
MTSMRAIADTTPTRSELRLVVLAQWIAAGLNLIRGATTTGRGLVGGAVALWRLAQAVRLAILLARRLKQAQDAFNSGAPSSRASGPASTPVPAWSLEAAPLDDDALRRAMAELEAVIADALSAATPRRASLWEPEFPARIPARTSHEADGPIRRPHGRPTPPLGLRPLRPPGFYRPYRRRRRTPGALNTAPTPIAPWRSGATPLAKGLTAPPERGRLGHRR